MRQCDATTLRRALWMVTARSRLPAASVAVALALTLAALLSAAQSLLPPATLPKGVYYGWTDGLEGRFQVVGAPCRGPAEGIETSRDAGHDATVGAWLAHPRGVVELRPPDVVDGAEALVFGAAVPVLSFAPPALVSLEGVTAPEDPTTERPPRETALGRLTVLCRSHAEASTRLGSAAVAFIPTRTALHGAPADIGITPRRVPPGSDLLGVLVLSNDTEAPLHLRALHYAPVASSTGKVRAAVGDRAQLASWLRTVFGEPTGRGAVAPAGAVGPAGASDSAPLSTPAIVESATVESATVSRWDATYKDPGDHRTLRSRSAADLDLLLAPGEMAIVVVDQRSLTRTLVARPVLLYPVLEYGGGWAGREERGEPGSKARRDGAQTAWVGLTTPLYGTTRSWRRDRLR